MTMIIFAVSPSYLRYIREESLKYQFKLQGYGSLSKALDGLMKTNASEIGGFILVVDRLPDNKSMLYEFIRLCDMISENSSPVKRFVFGLQDDSGLLPFLKESGFKNLEFYLSKFEIVTDSFIKKDMFGTILDSYYKPYNSNLEYKIKSTSTLKGLKYIPPLPVAVAKCLSPVAMLESVESSIDLDLYLKDLKSVSEIYYQLRLFGIKRKYDADYGNIEHLENMINDVSDKVLKERYRIILKYILEIGL